MRLELSFSIKTSVNGILSSNNDDNKGINSSSDNYNTNNENNLVEELDLNSYSSEGNFSSNNVSVTEETVLRAIEKNFENNRKMTNDMNNLFK